MFKTKDGPITGGDVANGYNAVKTALKKAMGVTSLPGFHPLYDFTVPTPTSPNSGETGLFYGTAGEPKAHPPGAGWTYDLSDAKIAISAGIIFSGVHGPTSITVNLNGPAGAPKTYTRTKIPLLDHERTHAEGTQKFVDVARACYALWAL